MVGSIAAQIKSDKAAYEASVATYRQTVLAAFQDVEDNLASVRILDKQSIIDIKSASNAQKALKLLESQYKAGIIDYSALLTAEITAYITQKNRYGYVRSKNSLCYRIN
ncbi:MAG: TolC family protein [Candidatus Rickettsia vulgarisii]